MVPGKPSFCHIFLQISDFFPLPCPQQEQPDPIVQIITASPNLCNACDTAPTLRFQLATATALQGCGASSDVPVGVQLSDSLSGAAARRSWSNYLVFSPPGNRLSGRDLCAGFHQECSQKKSREREGQEGWAEKQLNHNPLRGSGAGRAIPSSSWRQSFGLKREVWVAQHSMHYRNLPRSQS